MGRVIKTCWQETLHIVAGAAVPVDLTLVTVKMARVASVELQPTKDLLRSAQRQMTGIARNPFVQPFQRVAGRIMKAGLRRLLGLDAVPAGLRVTVCAPTSEATPVRVLMAVGAPGKR